jgi:hypothetical protein
VVPVSPRLESQRGQNVGDAPSRDAAESVDIQMQHVFGNLCRRDARGVGHVCGDWLAPLVIDQPGANCPDVGTILGRLVIIIVRVIGAAQLARNGATFRLSLFRVLACPRLIGRDLSGKPLQLGDHVRQIAVCDQNALIALGLPLPYGNAAAVQGGENRGLALLGNYDIFGVFGPIKAVVVAGKDGVKVNLLRVS